MEDLGKGELHAVRSQLVAVPGHLLELQASTADAPRRDWMLTVQRARSEPEERLTASLRRHLRATLPRLYTRARRDARFALELYGEREAAARLPERCPRTRAQLLDPDFWPHDPEDPHRRDFRRRRRPC